MELKIMLKKYRVIMTKKLFGNILVQANNKEEAVNEAYRIVKQNEYKWFDEEKIDAHEVYELPLICEKCNAKLPPESLYCNICGKKL